MIYCLYSHLLPGFYLKGIDKSEKWISWSVKCFSFSFSSRIWRENQFFYCTKEKTFPAGFSLCRQQFTPLHIHKNCLYLPIPHTWLCTNMCQRVRKAMQMWFIHTSPSSPSFTLCSAFPVGASLSVALLGVSEGLAASSSWLGTPRSCVEGSSLSSRFYSHLTPQGISYQLELT